MNRRIPLVALLLLVVPIVFAQQTATSIAERLEAIIEADPASERMHVGVYVTDAETGEVLYARNERKLFTPASNAKLFSSAFALETWTRDKTFETVAELRTSPEAGVRELVIHGGGDPVFGTEDLRALIDAVLPESDSDGGPVAVRIEDGSNSEISPRFRFHYGPGWMWDDFSYGYSMPVTRLMMDYNVQSVLVREGSNPDVAATVAPANDATRVWFDPALAPGTRWDIVRHAFEDEYIVSSGNGTSQEPRTIGGDRAVARPLAWIRSVAESHLAERGIGTVPGVPAEAASSLVVARTEIHLSPPLSEILPLFNKPSENAIGEMLLLGLGEQLGGEWTWSAGEKAMRAWLETVGLPGDSFRLVDGSGLSRYDLITPECTVALLSHMWRSEQRDVYVASLPIAGIDGTLSGRMKDTPAQGRVLAKTGTMSGVSCVSGYANVSEERTLVFSILTNGYVGSSAPTRTLQDRLCVALFDADGQP